MPSADMRRLLADARRLEEDRPVLTRLHLVLPFVILIAAAVLLALSGRLAVVAGTGLVALVTLGKLMIPLGAAPEFHMTPVELAFLIFFMDCWVAYLFAFNLHHVYRLPRVGPWLERLHDYCRYWLAEQPWMRRWAYMGVMLFVCFPLTGTGAPGGSILGRLAGLRAWVTLSAIALGSACGCFLLASFAEQLRPYFADPRFRFWSTAIGVAVVVMLVWLLVRLGRRLSRSAADYARSLDDSGGDS